MTDPTRRSRHVVYAPTILGGRRPGSGRGRRRPRLRRTRSGVHARIAWWEFELGADGDPDLLNRLERRLAGPVDKLSAADLVTALERIGVPARGETLRIDISVLQFIDHPTSLALDQYVAGRRATVGLQSAPSVVQRLLKLISLRALRREDTP